MRIFVDDNRFPGDLESDEMIKPIIPYEKDIKTFADPKCVFDTKDILVLARTYADAIKLIDACVMKREGISIDLDYDLNETKNGADIARYLVEHNIQDLVKVEVKAHSSMRSYNKKIMDVVVAKNIPFEMYDGSHLRIDL